MIRGAKAAASTDHAYKTSVNTLLTANNEMPRAIAVTTAVAILRNSIELSCFPMTSSVKAALQPKICESAVDTDAATTPARIKPTKTSGSNCTAIIGSANSASKTDVSGNTNRALSPTKKVTAQNEKYVL